MSDTCPSCNKIVAVFSSCSNLRSSLFLRKVAYYFNLGAFYLNFSQLSLDSHKIKVVYSKYLPCLPFKSGDYIHNFKNEVLNQLRHPRFRKRFKSIQIQAFMTHLAHNCEFINRKYSFLAFSRIRSSSSFSMCILIFFPVIALLRIFGSSLSLSLLLLLSCFETFLLSSLRLSFFSSRLLDSRRRRVSRSFLRSRRENF